MTLTTTTRRPSPTLLRLLDDELAFSPTFEGIYSNHLAMALVALDQMGAPPDVLERTFREHEAAESEPREDTAELQERRAEVARDGIEATVRRRLPALAGAPATALFHPAIRLAYGLDAGHEGQVAAALLYWEQRIDVLPTPRPRAGGSRRLAEVAAELSAAPPGTWPSRYDLRGVAVRPELAAAIGDLAVDEHTLDDVVAFALASHVATDAFVTLHMVTGARALHRLAPLLDDATALQLAEAAATAMAVAHATSGAVPLRSDRALDELRSLALPCPDELAERAVTETDPHVIKLANVALVEEERTGDRLYRFVAARVLGLVEAA